MRCKVTFPATKLFGCCDSNELSIARLHLAGFLFAPAAVTWKTCLRAHGKRSPDHHGRAALSGAERTEPPRHRRIQLAAFGHYTGDKDHRGVCPARWAA